MDIDTRIPATSTVLTSEQYAESKLTAKPDDGGLGRDAFRHCSRRNCRIKIL